YQITTASNGQAGYEKALALSPDLIVTDNAMPGNTGLQMLEALRQANHRVPAILMPAEGSEQVAVRALRAGVMNYFIKQFTIDDMVDGVARVLEATRAGGLRADILAQRYMQTFNTLIGVGKAVTSLLDLESILTRVVEAAVYLTDAEEGVLMLLDQETGELYMRATKNVERGFQSMRLRVRDSLAGQVVRTGKPLLISGEGEQKIKTSYLVRSLLYAPLKVGDNVVGVLGLHNRFKDKTISTRDVSVISALAEFAAIAVINAQLYSASEAERLRLARIFQHIPDPILIVDGQGLVTTGNPAAHELLGGQIENRPLFSLPRNEDLQRIMREAVRYEDAAGEVELADGRSFNAQIGRVKDLGYVISMQDITPLKAIDRAKSDLVASLSHDVRSPLTAILSYVELMERVGDFNERQQRFARQVANSVQSITHLINDLLELHRIEAGMGQQREQIYLSAIAEIVCTDMQGRAEMKRQTLDLQVDPGEKPVLGNPIRLRQVFSNLIDNAVKYSPEGGSVRVMVYAEDEQVIARVQDTGIGIPQEEQAQIFDKFYRVSEVSEDFEGTGLGLHIVATIIESHNGRIWVESTPGSGSMFTLMLPAHETELQTA
ncbi:MAG: ATP-binding protein, partial [Anaerolineae bacterium]